MDVGQEICLKVPSRIEMLSVINSVTEEVVDQIGFDEEARNAIAISVVEAGTNAIEHGNQQEAMRPTEICFRREADRLIILVRDQGQGFDPDAVRDPLAAENMFAARGRGVHILRSFMDEVQYEFGADGTRCRLVKFLPQHAQPAP
ncbi:MAG: ATP-binding protein [bacterium]